MKKRVVLGSVLLTATSLLVAGCEKAQAPEQAPEAQAAVTEEAKTTSGIVSSQTVEMPAPYQDGDMVVSVGDKVLTWGELSQQVEDYLKLLNTQPPSEMLPQVKQELRSRLVQEFIGQTLVTFAAEKYNLTLTDEDWAKVTENIKKMYGPDATLDSFWAQVPKEAQANVRKSMEATLLTEKIVATQVYPKVKVSDEDVATEAERIDVSIQLVKDEMASYAQTLATDPSKFDELQSANSEAPGEQVVTSRQLLTLPKSAQEILASTQDGAITPVVDIEGAEVIFKVIKRDTVPGEAEVRASHILVRPKANTPEADAEAKQAIEAARARVVAGEDFAKVAAEVSDCPSKERGGDLGLFGKGRMVKEFEDAAFSQPVNEVGPVIKTQFGYHIVKVTEQKAAEPEGRLTVRMLLKRIPMAETKDEIRQRLESERLRTEAGKFFEEQQKEAKIVCPLYPELNSK